MNAQINRPRFGFDPAVWLDSFTSIGGGYALMADRRLAFIVAGCDGDDLARIMAQIVGCTDRQEALKDTIERFQAGEVGS